jgi:hypothetical protein
VAGAGAGAAGVQLRVRSLRGRPSPRHRHRSSDGGSGGRPGERNRLLLGNGADGRKDAHDPDGRRLLGDAAPPRLARRPARGGRGRRRRRRHRRPERRAGAARALRVPRRAPDARAAGLPRPAALPAAPGARSAGCAARAYARSLTRACSGSGIACGRAPGFSTGGPGACACGAASREDGDGSGSGTHRGPRAAAFRAPGQKRCAGGSRCGGGKQSTDDDYPRGGRPPKCARANAPTAPRHPRACPREGPSALRAGAGRCASCRLAAWALADPPA